MSNLTTDAVFLLNIYRYNEKDELGRGSLGTAVYAGVYDEQEGRNTVVRRYAQTHTNASPDYR